MLDGSRRDARVSGSPAPADWPRRPEARLRSVLNFASFAPSVKRHGDPFFGRPKSTKKGTPAPLSLYLGTRSGTAQICATATEADMAIEGKEGQECSISTCAEHDLLSSYSRRARPGCLQ
jgi:hypothetical protein